MSANELNPECRSRSTLLPPSAVHIAYYSSTSVLYSPPKRFLRYFHTSPLRRRINKKCWVSHNEYFTYFILQLHNILHNTNEHIHNKSNTSSPFTKEFFTLGYSYSRAPSESVSRGFPLPTVRPWLYFKKIIYCFWNRYYELYFSYIVLYHQAFMTSMYQIHKKVFKNEVFDYTILFSYQFRIFTTLNHYIRDSKPLWGILTYILA